MVLVPATDLELPTTQTTTCSSVRAPETTEQVPAVRENLINRDEAAQQHTTHVDDVLLLHVDVPLLKKTLISIPRMPVMQFDAFNGGRRDE